MTSSFSPEPHNLKVIQLSVLLGTNLTSVIFQLLKLTGRKID